MSFYIVTSIDLQTDLFGLDFSGVDLTNIDLSGADLTDAQFNGTLMERANLSDCLLDGASLKRRFSMTPSLPELQALALPFGLPK